LSDGYVLFDDTYGKLPGPLAVTTLTPSLAEEIGNAIGTAVNFVKSLADRDEEEPASDPTAIVANKPYFIGREKHIEGEALPEFVWNEPEDPPLLKTTLHATHVEMGGRMVPFGGYDMPVWYSSVMEEHTAVRETAGLFDATHMGVFEASGPHVVEFLNTITTNDVSALKIGQSHYTYFLLPDGSVVDDLMIYRRGDEKFMLVVNASNNDKDWAWVNAVNEGRVMIDAKRPFAKIQHPVTLKDLRDRQWGDECRVDIPLQGPASRNIVLAMCDDEALAKRVKTLPWAGLTEGKLAGFDVVISRTGYTGERVAFELFVHPDKAPDFWKAVIKAGESFGLKPCGLASRDSTRTEAGLPLYGHELAGAHNLNPADAGFGSYAKLWKPFFIGRDAFIAHEEKRDRILVRFRMNDKAVRRPDTGDPVLDKRGKVVGTVTSCAVDSEGYMLGLALVPESMSAVGTAVAIYQLGGGKRAIKTPKSIKQGARLPMPDSATILTRFPSRKKK
jgi:glycine hydroxymethyltransferase